METGIDEGDLLKNLVGLEGYILLVEGLEGKKMFTHRKNWIYDEDSNTALVFNPRKASQLGQFEGSLGADWEILHGFFTLFRTRFRIISQMVYNLYSDYEHFLALLFSHRGHEYIRSSHTQRTCEVGQ